MPNKTRKLFSKSPKCHLEIEQLESQICSLCLMLMKNQCQITMSKIRIKIVQITMILRTGKKKTPILTVMRGKMFNQNNELIVTHSQKLQII